jgi:cbb3-type cytochrome oxidase subunit 3
MKNNKYNIHKISSLTVVFIGLVLLIYMITVESEPGALPLFLLLFGVVWFVINQKKKHR